MAGFAVALASVGGDAISTAIVWPCWLNLRSTTPMVQPSASLPTSPGVRFVDLFYPAISMMAKHTMLARNDPVGQRRATTITIGSACVCSPEILLLLWLQRDLLSVASSWLLRSLSLLHRLAARSSISARISWADSV